MMNSAKNVEVADLNQQALVLQGNGKEEKALEYFHKALAIDPRDHRYLHKYWQPLCQPGELRCGSGVLSKGMNIISTSCIGIPLTMPRPWPGFRAAAYSEIPAFLCRFDISTGASETAAVMWLPLFSPASIKQGRGLPPCLQR